MQNLVKNTQLESWRELIETLQNGMMADYRKYPEVYHACRIGQDTNDFTLLRDVLNRDPNILDYAIANFKNNPFLPYPMGDELRNIQGKFTLGYVNQYLDQVGLDPSIFPRGLFIGGGQGSGKTHPVLRMEDQMLRIPPKERGFNIINVQRSKHDADGFALKYPWFKVLGWRDLRYNMWQVDDWDDPRDKLASASTTFCGENFLYALTVPPMRYAVKKCYRENGVFEGSKNFPTFSEIMAKVPNYLKDFKIQGYEMTSSIGRLINRLVDFIEEGDILNWKRGLPTSFFLAHDLCLNVMDENEFTVRTTLMNIFYDIQRFLQKHPLSKPGMRILVIIDEARWLFDISRDKMDIPSNKILETWFTTCRESGFGRIILSQEHSKISQFVTNNCACRWTFPIFGESLDTAQKLHLLTDEQVSHIVKLRTFGEGIFSHPDFDRPFIIRVPSKLNLDKSISPEHISKIMRPFIQELQAQLPESKPEPVPINIKDRMKKALIDAYAMQILQELKKNPFTHYTAIKDKLRLPDRSGVELLESDGLIIVKKFKHSNKGKIKADYLILTEHAQKSLRIPLPQRVAPTHFKHSLYCERVKQRLESEGYEAKREYTDKGRYIQRIDVYAEREGKRIACEIQLSMNENEVMANVYKCLNIFGIHDLCMVCEDAKDIRKVTEFITGRISSEQYLKMISYKTINDFL